jgi:hypothetical protein
MSEIPEQFVDLLCLQDGGRLRVRITSLGYLTSANCQFPKALRAAGRRLRVPASAVQLVAPTPRRKAFYRVDGRSAQDVGDKGNANKSHHVGAIFAAGTEDGLCSVCLTEPLACLVVPCGHLCLCEGCAARGIGRRCIICRGASEGIVHSSEVD